jgi:hypothetical protein
LYYKKPKNQESKAPSVVEFYTVTNVLNNLKNGRGIEYKDKRDSAVELKKYDTCIAQMGYGVDPSNSHQPP